MNVRRQPRSLLLAVLLCACGGSATGTDESTAASTITTTGGGSSEAANVDPAVQALLDAAGDEAAVSIFFHPRHWSALSTVVQELAGEFLPEELRPILEAAEPWGAVRAAGREEGVDLPLALAGWDDSRPIILALFESEPRTLAELLNRSEKASPPVLESHRVVMPATDVPALATALMDVARATGCENASAALHRALAAPTGVLRCDELVVLFETGSTYVRMRAAVGDDRLIAASALARPANDDVAITPARRWATGDSVVLAAHVRPEHVRTALLIESATNIASVMGMVAPPNLATLLARGQLELVGQALRTAAIGAEVDDIALGLTTGLRPTFTIVHGLSEVGMAALDAGTASAAGGGIPVEGPENAPIVVRSSVDIDAMQAIAGPPPGFSGARDPEQAAERFEACGWPCSAQVLTSRVYGLGALADQVGLRSAIEAEIGPFLRFEPATLPAGVTMELTMDFPTLAARMGQDMFTRLIARRLGVVHAIQAREGRTVMTTVRFGETPPVPDPSQIVFPDPGPQGPGYPRDESTGCVETFGQNVENAIEALDSSAPAARREIAQTFRSQLQQLGGCADAGPALREVVQAYLESFDNGVAALTAAPGAPRSP